MPPVTQANKFEDKMIYPELRETAELSIVKLLQDWKSSDFIQFYGNLLTQHKIFLTTIERDGIKPNEFTSAHNKFNKQVKVLVTSTDIGSLYVSIHNLKKALSGDSGRHPLIENFSSELISHLDQVWQVLNSISKLPSNFDLVLKLIRLAYKIEKTFDYFDRCLIFLDITGKLLSNSTPKSEGDDEVIFIFSAEIITLSDFIDKLNTLKQIYTEACLLFEVEEAHHSLKVGKIESGSLFAKLFGESKVIEFIIWFAKESIKFLHRNYTTEGKRGKLAVNVEQLNEQIGLYEKLNNVLGDKRMAVLQNEQSETLQKSAILLSKQYQKLLERETKIHINNESLEVQSKKGILFLEGGPKQIENQI